MSSNIVLAFDAYGTLLSTESIAKQLAEHFGQQKAEQIAQTWRKYQLEYTWRLNSMGIYKDFDVVTEGALQHALAESFESLEAEQRAQLMRSYDRLSVFPDVPSTIEGLSSRPGLEAVIFSNGTQKMVSTSVKDSPDLGPLQHVFRKIVVIEDVKKYKPAPEAYKHLARAVGREDLSSIWLVSGNPFDIVGARLAGLNAIWVDRTGKGWQDCCIPGPHGEPTAIVNSLDQIFEKIAQQTQ